MYSGVKRIAFIVTACAVPVTLQAQFNFSVDGRQVQVHSFASQGFAYSNNNNYLTMKTSDGSFAFTDFGFNASTQLTDKFRVGAQIYGRNVGEFGNWKPTLDWAVADYRLKDWLGFRGGKVKTTLGLFNDTQDLEFLHTWALMPISVYPLDARSDKIAHTGGDIYGNISLQKLGGLNYTVYGGERLNDLDSGTGYGLATSSLVNGKYIVALGKKIDYIGGPIYGADLRWTTPLKGLLVGASYVSMDTTVRGSYLNNHLAYNQSNPYDKTVATYLQYVAGNFTFAGEYRKEPRISTFNTATGAQSVSLKNSRQGYVSASYRFSKWLELGAYHSRYLRDWRANHGDPAGHIFDQALTARVDLRSYLDLKIEGHFMDGAMIDSSLSRGFFAASNPNGINPQMKMFVMRLGFHM